MKRKKYPTKPGAYCLRCLTRFPTTERKRWYHCETCGYKSQRRFFVDTKTKVEQTKDGPVHHSAGVVLYKHGKILLMKRTSYPSSVYATPGGHVDKGETSLQAMRRELSEETGLRIARPRLLFHGLIRNDHCSRGVDHHLWWLYAGEAQGRLRKNDESEELRWVAPHQLKKLPLTYPVRFLVRKIFSKKIEGR